MIGVVLPKIVNPIFATFGHRFANSLAQSGYTPVLCSQTIGGVSEDDWVEPPLEKDMAGLIVVSGEHADVNADHAGYQRLLDRHIRSPWSTAGSTGSTRSSSRTTTTTRCASPSRI